MKLTNSRIRNGCRRAPGLILVIAMMALPALAASSRLDNANAHLTKARALLKAAGYSGEARTARSHRERAIKLIEQAEQEIARAKQAADTSTDGKPGLTMPRPNAGTVPRLK